MTSVNLSPKGLERHVSELVRFGNRFVGSAGERAACAYIGEALRRSGASAVREEPFEVTSYVPGEATCAIVGENEEDLPAVGLQFTASGNVTALATYLGNPESVEDIEELVSHGVPLAGKIAVVDTYWPYGLVPFLVEAGAVGVVVVSPNSEGVIAHFTAQLYPPGPDGPGVPLPIPGVTIERRAATRLLARLAAGPLEVSLSHRASYVPVQTANVVCEVRGTDIPHECVVIGAHYDTQLEGVGACDNGSGVAALIELAGQFAEFPARRTVIFVAFGDEEHGFHGAVEYCRRHAAELDNVVGMICLDALAWVYPGSRALHADPSLLDFAAEQSRRVGWDPEELVDASTLLGSDHNAFIDAGVPAAWFWRYPPQHPGYHSVGDRPELLDYQLIAETATAAGATARALANDPNGIGRSRPTRRWMDLRPRPEAVEGTPAR